MASWYIFGHLPSLVCCAKMWSNSYVDVILAFFGYFGNSNKNKQFKKIGCQMPLILH
jgi:hypothetical protein